MEKMEQQRPPFGLRQAMPDGVEGTSTGRSISVVIPATDTIIVSEVEGSADYSAWKAGRIRGVELRPKIAAASALALLRLRLNVEFPETLRDFPDVHRQVVSRGDGLAVELSASHVLFPPMKPQRSTLHVVKAEGTALEVRRSDLVFNHTIIASATAQETQQWATGCIVAETPNRSERVETTFDAAITIITALWSGKSFGDLLGDRAP